MGQSLQRLLEALETEENPPLFVPEDDDRPISRQQAIDALSRALSASYAPDWEKTLVLNDFNNALDEVLNSLAGEDMLRSMGGKKGKHAV